MIEFVQYRDRFQWLQLHLIMYPKQTYPTRLPLAISVNEITPRDFGQVPSPAKGEDGGGGAPLVNRYIPLSLHDLLLSSSTSALLCWQTSNMLSALQCYQDDQSLWCNNRRIQRLLFAVVALYVPFSSFNPDPANPHETASFNY